MNWVIYSHAIIICNFLISCTRSIDTFADCPKAITSPYDVLIGAILNRSIC